MTITKPRRFKPPKGCYLFIILLIIGLFSVCCGSLIIVRASPALSAKGADVLRIVLGDRAVARIEETMFRIEDFIQRIEYRLGLGNPAPPWEITPAATAGTPTPEPNQTPTPEEQGTPIAGGDLTATPQPIPTITSVPTWAPPPVKALGSEPGVGSWQPYIQNMDGLTVAYRTFLQPDPMRPYAMPAVVAFDLTKTRLNFVLGSEEPYALDVLERASGWMPADDRQPGGAIATFNGGFQYSHGAFGAMSNGWITAWPRAEMATLAIMEDGTVKIGAWGSDFNTFSGMAACRQNGPLLIRDGAITADVNDPTYWGTSVNGETVTWRSGVGISEDGTVLYYFAGPSLNIQALAEAMLAVNVNNGMQLDINEYWVHFAAIRTDGRLMEAEPLIVEGMSVHADRYLKQSVRDFFYITALGK